METMRSVTVQSPKRALEQLWNVYCWKETVFVHKRGWSFCTYKVSLVLVIFVKWTCCKIRQRKPEIPYTWKPIFVLYMCYMYWLIFSINIQKEESWLRICHQVDHIKHTFFAMANGTTPYIQLSATRLYKRSKGDLGAHFPRICQPKVWHTVYLLKWQYISYRHSALM